MAEEYEYYQGRYTGAQVDELLGKVDGKLNKPLEEGEEGYVLHVDGDGNPYWGSGTPEFNIHNLTTENNTADDDEIAIYDASASSHRKTSWSNIKAKLKAYFDNIYGSYSKPSGGIPYSDLNPNIVATDDEVQVIIDGEEDSGDGG